ncbi:flavin-containing monooxygenase [Rhizodiscina lignyota]|uniref:Flavin-containing monooxygenase n=1 Tax=Rhizodiscina lignyota TaxID=1504668 RepID=A0A9P4I512_9PEZI|nr:flavin-containing monooxygenase [Rhizodiscina lignyota]
MHSAQTPPVPIEQLKGSLPVVDIDPEVDAKAIATSVLQKFPVFSESTFIEDGIWRDLYALTSTFRTLFSRQSIIEAWTKLSEKYKPSSFQIATDRVSIEHAPPGGPPCSWIQAPFTFTTATTPSRTCSGAACIIPDSDNLWKIWCLMTVLESVEGFGDVDHLEPEADAQDLPLPSPVSSNASVHSLSWSASAKPPSSTNHFDCIIIGAGQSSLNTAGRMKALGASAVILEQNAHIGQNWLFRYRSLHLHTPVRYSTLAFTHVYPKDAPYFLHGADVGRGLQYFAQRYGIDVRTSSHIGSATWDEVKKEWSVNFTQNGGTPQTFHTPHLVLSMGHGGQIPKYPSIPNQAAFTGEIMHSLWAGKRAVIIGAANTAHDIARDMVDAGLAPVTMVQRRPTTVIRMDPKGNLFSRLYREGFPTESADRAMLSTPTVVRRLLTLRATEMFQRMTPDYYERLEGMGFRIDKNADIWQCLYERIGGHHIDVGVGEKVAQGLIKVKSGTPIASFKKDGLVFEDGSELEADVIIFATGFENSMRDRAADILGDEIADGLDGYYGLDEEGELRGVWKYTGHPGLFYAGGDFGHARFYSRFLALRMKANLMGVSFEEYTEKP